MIDTAIGGGLHRAGVHLFEGDLLQGRSRCGMPWCPPLGVAIHLAWRVLAREVRADARRVAWIGDAVKPSGRMLLGGMRAGRMHSCSPSVHGSSSPRVHRVRVDRRLLEASFHLSVTRRETASRLWAIEQAVACPGVAMVVADGRSFDDAAVRRLHLAAIAAADDRSGAHRRAGLAGPNGSMLVLLREPGKVDVRSAVSTRWNVCPASVPLRAGEPAWSVHLLRARGRQALARFDRVFVAHCGLDWEEHHDLEEEESPAGRSQDLCDRDALSPGGSRASKSRSSRGIAIEARIDPGGDGVQDSSSRRRARAHRCEKGNRWTFVREDSAAGG